MAEEREIIGVLFVCMGNICRSPTAEGVFRKLISDAGLADRVEVDSAGTHAYHVGEPPDRRAAASAEERGYSLEGIRARRVAAGDFEQYDYVLAMDSANLSYLREQTDELYHAKLRLFLDFSAAMAGRDVPDPYYGGAAGFERVLDLVEDAAQGLIDDINRRLAELEPGPD